MPITSKPLFIYLQRPDTGEWVTVGRYLAMIMYAIMLLSFSPANGDGDWRQRTMSYRTPLKHHVS